MENNTTGILIQARLGSTRMPGKILAPFYGRQTILDIILGKTDNLGLPVIVATTQSEQDDAIENFCNKKGVRCYRGDEDDVLSRFIACAGHYGIGKIIRVCSDNPFLDKAELIRLVEATKENGYDYIGFNIGGTPSIKTHFGFWAESVTLGALKKIASLTDEKTYHEHVTNYIYTHAGNFEIKWLETPGNIAHRHDIRLTIDTPADFSNASELYGRIASSGNDTGLQGILSYIDAHPVFKTTMKNEIAKNSK